MEASILSPRAGVGVQDAQVKSAIEGIPGKPNFSGTLAEGVIKGTFTQGDQSFPFVLGREPMEAPKRPQEPKEPFPYRSEGVTYPSGQITLAGTLTVPPGKGPFPAVLLISGSGPQDRDDTIYEHKPFLVLADHLSRNGIEVLRVDDRGVGGSTGDLSQTPQTELAEDVLAGVSFLSKRSEVNHERIGLIGQSEGGMIAPLVAARSRQVAFLVLMGAPGLPGDSILTRQTGLMLTASGATVDQMKAVLDAEGRLLTRIEAGADSSVLVGVIKELVAAQLAAQPGSSKPSDDVVDVQARRTVSQMTSPWFRGFLIDDPRPALRQVHVPVLVLAGNLDLQVDPEQNLPQITAALQEAGNRHVTVRRFPGLNHLFQTARIGLIQEYPLIEETINPEVLASITEWIKTGAGFR
jgi:uncharacterized protein